MILRKRLLQELLSTLDAGESGVLIGASSMGKSRLLRILEREETRQAIRQSLQKEKASTSPPALPTLYIFVDFNRLHGREDWLYYEIMLSALLRALDKWVAQHQEHPVHTVVERLYEQTVQSKDSLLALRYLERGVGLLVEEFAGGVVFLMDETDATIREAPASFFRTLKALRDEYKYRVRYLVSLRDEIARIRENVDDIEPFYEYVTLHVFYIGPYSSDDAAYVLETLLERHKQTWPPQLIHKIIDVSGGHPGLLRELHAWVTHNQRSLPEQLDVLLRESQIWEECVRLWQSLHRDEQQALYQIANRGDLTGIPIEVVRILSSKGLITVAHPSARIFSPLFAAFARQHAAGVEKGIKIQGGRVWVDGREVDLTRSELRLLEYLVHHAGEVCSREDLIQYVYKEEYDSTGGDIADMRLDSLIYRLREKVEPDRRHPRYILTIRGRGFKYAGPPRSGEP